MPTPYAVLDPYSVSDKHKPAPPAGSGVQAIGQLAANKQDADSSASASQQHVSNLSAPVRIGSPGSSGSTTQANTVLAVSLAANGNTTHQTAHQSQGGAGTLVQGSGQLAKSTQDAKSCADATQKDAKNVNAPLRLFSEGSDGSTTQSNAAIALSAALNGNKTGQTAGQSQTGAPGSTLVQGSGQGAFNEQNAWSGADTKQHGVENTNAPVRLAPPPHKSHKPCEPKRPCEAPKPPCEPKRPCETKPPVGPPGYHCDAPMRDGGKCERPIEKPKCAPRKPDVKPCDRCDEPKAPCKPRGYRLDK
jgi:hypothetical protein